MKILIESKRFLLLLCLSLFVAGYVSAQDYRAIVKGIVTDQLWQQNRLETDDNPITIPIFTYFRHCPQHSDGRPENRPELFSDNALPDYTAPFIFGPWRILSQARHTMTTKDPLNSYCLADLSSFFSSDSGAVRTLDPQLRRLLLYPTELRNQRLQHIIA